jgi:hypothetical protein
MSKLFAFVLVLLSFSAQANEDLYFKIGQSGRISDIPSPWGPVQVSVQYVGQGRVSSVQLKGSHFNVRLSPCVLHHLDHVTRVEASGSWWHDRRVMPPYMSLHFVQAPPPSPRMPPLEVDITFSLWSGHILMAQRWRDPWWGAPRAEEVWNARSCAGWDSL